MEDCPEYETVSYTWAGEDGDGSLCKPVYIGPFYDILLQTKNCWEMLRFMRPWRGTRMVWVDAICINQSDVLERNAQVGLMSKIYSAGSRVVVYLGPDIATPLHGRHPRRRRLHYLESGTVMSYFPGGDSPHSLQELLKMRYFSRIWVIQELLLSQRVVMRVGDVDYWADPVMTEYFSSSVPNWDWKKSQAPWVQHISKGTSSVQNLRDLLGISSLSRATDPRDRVFGLLGIMPQHSASQTPPLSDSRSSIRSSITSQVSMGGLYADYSLSCQHVFIGLFAYCLFVMWHPGLLFHASCSRRPPHYPSWAPDWRSQTTWRLLFRMPKMSSQEVFHKVHKMIQDRPAEEVAGAFSLYELQGPARRAVEKARAWHRGAHVCASTGALRINVTHYLGIRKPLVNIGNIHGFNVFQMRAKTYSAYLLSEHSLDETSGLEQVFVLNISDYSKMYLILDPIGGGRYRLVSTCPFVMIQVPTIGRENEIPSIRSISLQDLQFSLHDSLSSALGEIDGPFSRELRGLFPGKDKVRDILPLLLLLREQMKNGEAEISSKFIATYLECISREVLPNAYEGYVSLTISNRWGSIWNLYMEAASWIDRLDSPHPWEYRVLGVESDNPWASTTVSHSTYKKLTSGSEQFVEIIFPLSEVLKLLIQHKPTSLWSLWETLDRLDTVASRGQEDLSSMLNREPTDEDQFVGCPSWKYLDHVRLADILGDFDSTGSTVMVSID